MNTDHETLRVQPVNMPFVLDGPMTASPPLSPDSEYNPEEFPLSSSLQRSHRTQSASAVLHHPLRVPETVPEDVSLSSAQGIPGSMGSPSRRPRANTGVSKPRTSAERQPEDDVNWWTEEIHKRRELRKRHREEIDENTVIIGNKVDTNHPNYVTAYNMLTGLRVAVFALLV
jgi:1-phosphatidylinositol-4-phosphate 5-kinase